MPTDRAGVFAMKMPERSKVVLVFLLDNPARVFDREELGQRLGLTSAVAEVGIVWIRRKLPGVMAGVGLEGEVLRGRHGFIKADSPLRAAWEQRSPAPAVAPAPPPLRVRPPDFRKEKEVVVNPGIAERKMRRLARAMGQKPQKAPAPVESTEPKRFTATAAGVEVVPVDDARADRAREGGKFAKKEST